MTLWSLFAGLLWFTIAAEVVIQLRRKVTFFMEYGVTSLYICIGAALFRVFIPMDFPWTRIIYSRECLPAVWSFLRTPMILGVNVLQVLAFIWITGGVYESFRYIRFEYRCASFMRRCTTSTTPQIERISAELGLPEGMACIHPAVPTPLSTGIFHKKIYLTNQSFTDEEMRFLLLHESTHLKHHDALVKLLFLMLRCILWWDPPVRRLYSEIDNMLEFRCDRSVTKGYSPQQRARYLSVLAKVALAQYCAGTDNLSLSAMTVFRRKQDENILVKRSTAIQKRKEPTLAISFMTVVVLVFVFFLSYLIVLQPVIRPPEVGDNEGIVISPETSYIVHEEDGSFVLWIGDKRMGKIPEESLNSEPHCLLEIREGSD